MSDPFILEASELPEIIRPPSVLHARGERRLLGHLPDRGLAVVGTRRASARALRETRSRIAELSGTGLVIVSGLARGIDAAAHRAALDHGLATVAVLGCGIDQAYPPRNEALLQEILARGGLVLSEYPPGVAPVDFHFIQRNRIIASLARATWVVEAGHRSGALNTAKWCRELGRPCLATPCYPGDPSLAGNQKLIDDHHAHPLWGTHSLGVAWLGLAAAPGRAPDLFEAKPPGTDAKHLAREVARFTARQGGVSATDLLDHCVTQQNWEIPRYFAALQESVARGLVVDENGLLLKN